MLRAYRWMIMTSIVAWATVAMADQVELSSGDVLTGTVVEQSDEQVVLEHPVLGTLTVPAAHVAAVTIAPPAEDAAAPVEPPAEGDTAQAEAAEPVEVIPPSPPGFFEAWDLSLAVGFSGSSGNSDTNAFNAQFKALKEDETDRWLFDAGYFFGSDSGDRTRNEFTAELTKDWLMPDSPWFYFAKAGYQYDEFMSWESRISGFGGVGYTFIKEDDIEIVGRLGAGLTQELGGEENLTPEGLIGGSILRWHITENQNLTASTTLYPALDDWGEYRVTSAVEWTIKLDHADGLSLKLGLANEYETEVAPGDDHNDLKYYGALVLDF